jgi:hypothetical protein
MQPLVSRPSPSNVGPLPVGDVPCRNFAPPSPSSRSAVTDACQSAHSDPDSEASQRVSGPTRRRKTSRATLGSARRSAFHCSARWVNAVRNLSRFGGAGRGARSCDSTLVNAVCRSFKAGAIVSGGTPAAIEPISRSTSVRSQVQNQSVFEPQGIGGPCIRGKSWFARGQSPPRTTRRFRAARDGIVDVAARFGRSLADRRRRFVTSHSETAALPS